MILSKFDYDGNSNETYTLFQDGESVLEIPLAEDDVSLIVRYLNHGLEGSEYPNCKWKIDNNVEEPLMVIEDTENGYSVFEFDCPNWTRELAGELCKIHNNSLI